MTLIKRGIVLSLGLLLPLCLHAQNVDDKPFFHYDKPDEKIPAVMLDNPLGYDAGIASAKEGQWIAWLELQPGKGDSLWIGLRSPGGNWISKTRLSSQPGDFANPTPLVDAQGKLWVTYESALTNGDWNVFAQQQKEDGTFFPPLRISPGNGADINHRVAAHPQGGLWFTWQSDRNGQFDILARQITKDGMSEPMVVSTSPLGDWQPGLTIHPNGDVYVVWDSYDGDSYNVVARSLHGKAWGKITTLAGGPAFQAHAQIGSGENGKIWVLWEEDGENWGKTYRARTPGNAGSTKIGDKVGPLHRFRRLNIVELDPQSLAIIRTLELPMPSLEAATKRPGAPAEVKFTGAFYEGGQITVDGKGHPWVTYRHFYTPFVGIVPEHHKQDSWILYARCLVNEGWSKLYAFEIGQGDGLQRFSVVPNADGIAAAWTTGRTDRRKSDKPHGIALASLKLASESPVIPKALTKSANAPANAFPAPVTRGPGRPATGLAGKNYELFFGDLHRHTDISLCFAPSDGSIDDAYRYAIDAAPLDFLGITDHTHDLAMGDPLSLIWWRSRKEVNRHQLQNTFVPFYSYERSRPDTDHNVISLRDDMLRPHTYPLTQFWDQIDTNTFTIAHQPFNRLLWNYHDDIHRPLVELYQGFRNDAKEGDAREGLVRGHKFGIIASSDHLSTSASYACVWSADGSREGIFRAMQARRTYGATARIRLKVFAGDHWMGESFTAKTMPPICIEAQGTASIAKVEIFVDGDLKQSLPGSSPEAKFTYEPDHSLTGPHLFYVRLEQSDGNRAWSSPLWVDIKP